MRIKHLKFLLLACSFGVAVSGCGLPGAAPTATDMEARHDTGQEFYLIHVDSQVLPYLERPKVEVFPFGERAFGYTPSIALRPGDVVDVSIFESGGSSLFSAPSGPSTPGAAPSDQSARTTLPSQVIERDGNILVPFVGAVQVAGKTPMQAAHVIEQGLSSQTVRPQVIVSVGSNGSNVATINGDVNKPGPFPLTLRGERLLDAIAFAGGNRYPITETDLRLIRGSTGATVSLQQLMDHPNQNVRVRPNDEIIAVHSPKTFTVLGATTKPAQYNFDTPHVTLAEAVARAGGFVDTYGDPGGVFIYRREPLAEARSILAAAAPKDITYTAGSRPHALVGPKVPILYRVDMNTSDGYFHAQKMQVANGDVIVIADAEGAQLVKVLTVVRGVTGIVYDISGTSGK